MKASANYQVVCNSISIWKADAIHFEIMELKNSTQHSIPRFSNNCLMMYLVDGSSRVDFIHKSIVVNRPALVITNPTMHFSSEAMVENCVSYALLFTEAFIKYSDSTFHLQHSTLPAQKDHSICFLTEAQAMIIHYIFNKIVAEMNTTHIYKYDMIRNYLHLILHEAHKLHEKSNDVKYQTAAERITFQFIELLDKQFPIDSPQQTLQLKTARDFAEQLSVHVNHLNSAVRSITGKTTTTHITERIILEAKALLKNTDWNVSEIAYSLGFEYPTYFNNFFKKQTDVNPLYFRT